MNPRIGLQPNRDYRHSPRSVPRDIVVRTMDNRMPLLTVIVPAYNEAATIGELLQRVLAAPYSKQVVIVDDGSTDGTVSIVEAWAAHPQVELLEHSGNRGKGTAIRTGLEHAQGRFVIIQDGDLEYDPDDYAKLIEPLLAGEAEVVYGSRYLVDDTQRSWGVLRCGVAVLNICTRLLYGARLTDEATCYKALPTALLRVMDLQCKRFEFCPEVTAKACRLGLRILEVPISYNARSVKAGKKIRWTDGLQALRTLWRWRRWRGPPLGAMPRAGNAESAMSQRDMDGFR